MTYNLQGSRGQKPPSAHSSLFVHHIPSDSWQFVGLGPHLHIGLTLGKKLKQN